MNKEKQQTISIIKLILLSRERMQTLNLPKQAEGEYCILDSETGYKIVSARAILGKWYLYSEAASFIIDEYSYINEIAIDDREFIAMEDLVAHKRFHLLIEQNSTTNNTFYKYRVDNDLYLNIGRSPSNDICYNMIFVSRNHATLVYHNSNWEIYDNDSANGIYVNGKKIIRASLQTGDYVYIVGLRIIVGLDFLAINSAKEELAINVTKLQKLTAQFDAHQEKINKKMDGMDSYFSRLPRKIEKLEFSNIVFYAPPVSLKNMRIPLLLRYGGTLLTGNITSMVTSALFPILAQKYSDKEKREYERLRVEKYTQYLEEKRMEISVEKDKEQKALNSNYPPLERVLCYAKEQSRLWERRITDDDFLNLRIGIGRVPMIAQYEYPKKKFEMDEDPLEEQMYHLAENKVMLEQVPIMSSLFEKFVCGVLGSRNLCLEFIHRLILQISLLYSYDEVKMIFLLEKPELDYFQFIKFLPHCWDEQQSIRFIATNAMEACSLSEYIQKELEKEERKKKKLEKFLKQNAYYIIFALDKKIFDSMEVVKEILAEDENIGFSIVSVYDRLPKECTKIFQLSMDENTIIHLDGSGEEEQFTFDFLNEDLAKQAMGILANLKLRTQENEYVLPKMITFLELFHVGKIEQLNSLKRWNDNNPVKSLATPVGVGTDGMLFDLDLHEKRQGPHGLIAGMTGSGKSEFIITYILSMAVNYHPDEVAFILIDYKGGGLAGAFEDEEQGIHLPHLVGTITNLDGASIQRSLASIQSELLRRQEIFNEAKRKSKEGTMDIYTYQKLYRQRIVENPVPHLFIISDEFAELKAQQSAFMDKLISTARIGRSLGVHLILATQKPSGVVDNQIWSNTKFRVCLRVQDRMDSVDMLKRPEAAELKDTGRFYMQVGYNEYFAMGQSAWCGAEYEPKEEAITQQNQSVCFIDTTGRVILEERPKTGGNASGVKQIVAIVNYLSDLAKRNDIKVRRLWQPALPFVITLDSIIAKYHPDYSKEIQALIGLADDPEKQSQYPLLLDLQNCQHYIIMGEAGSGKTTLIQTLLLSLVTRYTPEQLNYYIMDFSSHTLRVYSHLQHCGMCINEEENDAVNRFFTMLRTMIDERKQLFNNAEVSSYNAYIQIHALPLVVIIIDNISALQMINKEVFYRLEEYLRDGGSVGIKFLLSGNHENDFSAGIRRNCKNRIALRLKDRFDYTSVLGCKCSYEPPEGAGRGLCNYEGRPLEYQTALGVDCVQEQGRIQIIRNIIEELEKQYRTYNNAQRLPIINEEEEFEEFCADIKPDRLAIGYSYEFAKKIAIPFQQLYALSVYWGNPDGVVPILSNFLYAALKNQMKIYIVRQLENSKLGDEFIKEFDGNAIATVTMLDCTKENLTFLWKELTEAIGERKALRDQYYQDNHLTPDEGDCMRHYAAPFIRQHSKSILVLFERFVDFCTTVDDAGLQIYPALFTKAKWYNCYYLSCFYQEDFRKLGSELLYQKFNPDKLILLFGGAFQQQNMVPLPKEYAGIQKKSAYNRGLLHYQDQLHPIIMPCGEQEEEKIDLDELPLF